MFKFIFTFVIGFSISICNAATYQVLDGTATFDSTGSNPFTLNVSGGGSFTEGVFDGSAYLCCSGTNDTSATASGFQSLQFRAIPLYTYFAATGSDGATHMAPTINLTNMSADMTSFYANWNDNEIYQGAVANVTDLGSGIYELAWSGLDASSVFSSIQIDWTMRVSQVPVPAAVWLFGSGLLGLAAFSRRKIL